MSQQEEVIEIISGEGKVDASTLTLEELAWLRSYEAEAKLMSVLEQNSQTPSNVHNIRIEGPVATRESFLRSAFAPALRSRTLGETISSIQRTASNLQRLDIFDELDLLFDVPIDPFASEGSMDVVVNVKEKSRVWVRTGTEIGNGEGSMNASLNVRNVFGAAEQLKTNASFGTRTSSAFNFTLQKPLNASPDTTIDLNAHSVVRNNMLYSSHEEVSRGAGLRLCHVSRLGHHELAYDASHRILDRLAPTASLTIRQAAGHSLKSAVSHVFIRDRRDELLLPTRGYLLRVVNEFAGSGVLGGDANFFKTEVETQANARFGGGWSVSLAARGGLLYTLDGKPSRISDRFMLGGAMSVRGFRTYGIGPRDGTDSVGGDAYWAAGLSLFAPLPRLRDYPLRAHLFLNGGSLIPYNHSKTPRQTFAALTASPSVAAGFGLVYRHPLARLEVNFCVPISAVASDSYKRGLQLGLGVQFL